MERPLVFLKSSIKTRIRRTSYLLGSMGLLVFMQLQAATYIVPNTYDNMVNSVASQQYGVIKQANATLTTNVYTIGGVSAKYRCLSPVQKITCRAGARSINVVMSEAVLKDPTSNEILNNYATDVRVEEDVNSYYICGAAYAGMTYDDFSMSSDATTGAITYEYKGNVKVRGFVYFTDVGNAFTPASTSVGSYMTVQYQQICR